MIPIGQFSKAQIAITDDADWASVLTKVLKKKVFHRNINGELSSEQADTVLPNPEILCSRLLSSGKIWEEDGGSIFL